MRLEMEELRNAKPPVSKDTPPPKVKGPTPAATPQAQRKKPSPSEVACAQKQSEPQTEGARMARLRRLCEKNHLVVAGSQRRCTCDGPRAAKKSVRRCVKSLKTLTGARRLQSTI